MKRLPRSDQGGDPRTAALDPMYTTPNRQPYGAQPAPQPMVGQPPAPRPMTGGVNQGTAPMPAPMPAPVQQGIAPRPGMGPPPGMQPPPGSGVAANNAMMTRRGANNPMVAQQRLENRFGPAPADPRSDIASALMRRR